MVSSSSPETVPEYAVVIPAYLAAATLPYALDSIVAQTLPARQVVVVDDGSPDGNELAAIVARYRGAVQLVRQSNAGPASARNTGVRATSTPWVAFLDADDTWLAHKMQVQMPLAQDPQAALLHGGARSDRLALPAEMDFEALWRRNRICTSMTVVRREVFDAMGGFFEARELIGAEDYSLWLRIAHAGWRVRACEGLVGRYTPVGGSLTSRIERCAAAEIRNAEMLGAHLSLPASLVRWKVRTIRTDFARHLIHARKLRQARSLVMRALCERPTLERLRLMSISCLPVSVLDMRRRLRFGGRRPFHSL